MVGKIQRAIVGRTCKEMGFKCLVEVNGEKM